MSPPPSLSPGGSGWDAWPSAPTLPATPFSLSGLGVDAAPGTAKITPMAKRNGPHRPSSAAPVPAGGADGAGESARGAEAPAGAEIILGHVKTLPSAPGVYRMINRAGDVLYVGKAKNLKRRVASYTKPGRLGVRMRRVVSATAALEIVTTHTEAEALLLESNLIKS